MVIKKKKSKAPKGKGGGKGGKAKQGQEPEAVPNNNPRAFAFQSAGKAKSQQARTAERSQRRLHPILSEQLPCEPPPLVVLVQGPPKVS